MTPDELRASLGRLKLSQLGAARIMGVDGRTMRKWCAGAAPVPGPVILALQLLEEIAPK